MRIEFLPFACLLVVLPLVLSGCETMKGIGNTVGKSLTSVSAAATPVKPAAPEAGVALSIQSSPECPRIKVLTDLSRITQFSDDKKQDDAHQVASARFHHLETKCLVGADSVTLDMAIDFMGDLGKIGVSDLNGQANYTYPYFLSVVTPEGQILSKDVFALSMVYENKQTSIGKREDLRQVIPLAVGQDSGKFQVIIGFQLSEQELAYNRLPK